jgi:hypothetical protein
MKFITSVFLIALLSFASCLYLPWWSIAVASFLVAAFISQSPIKSFISGFAGVGLLWAGLSFYISIKNEHILAHKVSLLILKVDNPYLLIVATVLIGAFVGGFSALTASFIQKKKQSL